MEDQAPNTVVYPDAQWPTASLVGTLSVGLRRDSDSVMVLAQSTAGIVEDDPRHYVATRTTPAAEAEYTWVWTDGTLFAYEPMTVAYSADSSGPVSSLTLTELRQHVETDLEDTALQMLLDDATTEIVRRFGDDGAITRVMYGSGPFLTLRRPAAAVTSIVEASQQRVTLLTLVPGDYALVHGGRLIERLTGASGLTGYSQGWAPVVTVVYTPLSEQLLRNRVSVDLVKLAVRYAAVENEKIGDFSVTYTDDYLNERERILQAMAFRRGMRIA